MSTGWTAPGSSDDSSRSPQAQAPEGPGVPSPTSAAPGPAPAPTAPGQGRGTGKPLQRELVQQVPLFPLRPLSVGEVLGAAVRIYRRRAKSMLVLSAAVHGVAYVLITALTGASMLPLIGETRAMLESPEPGPGSATVMTLSQALSTLGTSLVTGLISMVAAAMVTAVLTRVAIGEATGEPLRDSELWPTLRSLALPAIGVSALVGLLILVATAVPIALGLAPLLIWQEANAITIIAVLVGLIASIVLAIWLYARTLLAVPALVVEKPGVVGAIRRSFALTAGRRMWRVLGLGVLLSVLYYVAVQMLSGVFSVVGTVAYVAILLATNMEGIVLGVVVLTVVMMLGAYIATFLLAPYLSSGTAAIYADNRMRHEAWDIELNRRARDNWNAEPQP